MAVFLFFLPEMQDIDHRCLEDKANDILTAIVHGMKKEEPSNHVRLAATNALFNSLEFTRANFEREVRYIVAQRIINDIFPP